MKKINKLFIILNTLTLCCWLSGASLAATEHNAEIRINDASGISLAIEVREFEETGAPRRVQFTIQNNSAESYIVEVPSGSDPLPLLAVVDENGAVISKSVMPELSTHSDRSPSLVSRQLDRGASATFELDVSDYLDESALTDTESVTLVFGGRMSYRKVGDNNQLQFRY